MKVKTAEEKGAKGVILFNGVLPKDDEDKLTAFRYDRAAGYDIPAVHLKRNIVQKLFDASGKDLKKIQEEIDNSKTPSSFQLENVRAELSTEVNQEQGEGRNVASILEAENSDEYLVIGAHFDHLGYGTTGSLYRGDEPKIHNGADDNASGTSGILEIAEKFALQNKSLNRNIIFIAFSGEELGLLGSAYFVRNSPVPINNIVAMFNLDMIGRMNERKLMVYGTGTSSIWKDILNENNEPNFKLTFNDEGFGPSDHSSFYAKEIPVLFFFTGTHSDYHRPSDEADKINSAEMEELVNYVYKIADIVQASDQRPDYINVPRKDSGRMMAFRVYVGTIPDYSDTGEGFRISGVTEESPAQKAGLQAGDIIKKFGGKEIKNIYDYTYALADFAPGDIVDVVIQRENETLTLQVELGAR
jgi:aminopeptidase YwaD